jgi:acyl-CoA thioesterase I
MPSYGVHRQPTAPAADPSLIEKPPPKAEDPFGGLESLRALDNLVVPSFRARMLMTRTRFWTVVLAMGAVGFWWLLLFSTERPAMAAEIVALGASNTSGAGGLPKEQAYPAQLEAMLRARNCTVSVMNAGVFGDTTSDMLGRLPALLGSDTKVLIIQGGEYNNERRGLHDTEQDKAAMKALAAQHGVRVIMLDNVQIIAGDHHSDRIHFDAEGHAAIARSLLPKVMQTGVCRR